jgi:hypothetical protein
MCINKYYKQSSHTSSGGLEEKLALTVVCPHIIIYDTFMSSFSNVHVLDGECYVTDVYIPQNLAPRVKCCCIVIREDEINSRVT